MKGVRLDSLQIRIILGLLGLSIVVMSVLYLWHIIPMLLQFYIYSLMGLSLPMVFLVKRARGDSVFIPWYDLLLSIIGLSIGVYFMLNATNIFEFGWEYKAPAIARVIGCVLLLLLLEGTRRSYGWIIFGICAFFMIEPMFSGYMPGPLEGQAFSFERTITQHVFGYESIIGPVGRAAGELLIGFLIFAGALQATGGGQFFLDLALSLFGKSKGAPAKVSVISSSMFGMLSGSAVANVLTTGAFTIPAMKRVGYAPHYAASVEACASSGGHIMPPVMSTVAFIMAEITQVSYWKICLASFLPAVVYYVILYVQAASYAEKHNMRGLTKEEMPSFWRTLLLAYPYVLSAVVLIWFLAFVRQEGEAPFYALLALIAIAMIRKQTRLSVNEFWEMLMSSVKLIAEIMVLLFTLGVVAGALTMTGLATTFGYELVRMVGNATYLLPIVAAVIAYVMGMGLPSLAIYLLMSITIVPAMVNAGFGLIPSHLFAVYVGNMSLLIPPVAVAAITAGKLAGDPRVMKVGMTSMRLGMGILVLPLVFIYIPGNLIGEAPWGVTALCFLCSAVGFSMVAMSFERFAVRFNLSVWQAILLGVGGAAVASLPFFFRYL